MAIHGDEGPLREATSTAAATAKKPDLGDGTMTIAQVNLKKNGKRLRALLNHMKTMTRPWDIVAVQDPPLHFAWSSTPLHDI